MNPPFFIRQAASAECEKLFSLFEELDEHHRLTRPDVFRVPPGARRELSSLDQLMAGPDSTILVSEGIEGMFLGLAVLVVKSVPESTVREARRFVELDQLIVRFCARRRGVGRALINASKAWAQSRNISSLEVTAWSFNAKAIEFYRKVGFQPTTARFAMACE